jgi:16S rRNA (cytidine1402-2'-O)-methyltransferase
MSAPQEEPRVIFIPTPIGNLGDLTLRALETLKNCDLIACEDTRHSRRLLDRYEVKKPLISLHEHNEQRRIPELIAKASEGLTIGVISDAGTPCLSDPGHRLLKACIEEKTPYDVLPGPSAITTALVLSGFPPHPFYFGGFLPFKKGKRSKELTEAIGRTCTSLYFESPHRILSTLGLLRDVDPQTNVCITKELTKKFQNIYRGRVSVVLEELESMTFKGELVFLINPKH